MSFFTKQEKSNDKLKEVPVSDFIPYACHYDADTLLTKNGELLNIIKIVGFNSESIENKRVSLRDAVRQAIFESVDTNDYAVWFHTIRRKENLDPGGDYPTGFSDYLNKQWQGIHHWNDMYVNELYITIVREGESASISDPHLFMRGLIGAKDRKHRKAYLKQAELELECVSEKMLNVLQQYGARRLGVYEEEGVYYSELLSFLGKIINLEDVAIPLPYMDLSEYLPAQRVLFGYNALEVTGNNGSHFGAMLTIKEYKELSTKVVDEFLQLPQRFIISQCVDFINQDIALQNYHHQHKMTKLSDDADFARMSGLEDIVNSGTGGPIDFGEQQLTVMLLEDSLDELEKSIERAIGTLGALGIVVIREDIKMEDCYWAQLPGNFEFVTRLTTINTSRVAGFASLHNFPAGKAFDNHWGPAVTVFYTAAGTPYYFNFHTGNVGHSTIIGPYGAGKTVLLNFLCSEARKFNGPLFFFDRDRGSEIFLRAVGGEYHRVMVDAQENVTVFAPVLLPDTPDNRRFLAFWIESLLLVQGMHLSAAENSHVQSAVDYLYNIPQESRSIYAIAYYWESLGQNVLSEKLSPWYGEGQYAYLFENTQDTLSLSGDVHGFEMGSIANNPHTLPPMLLYLFHRLNERLDGSPAMIVLDEAWSILDNPVLAPRLNAWLTELSAKNAIAVLATESVEEAGDSKINHSIMDHIATEIYLPNPNPTEAYRDVFGLSDKEFRLLSKMQSSRRHLMLKRGGDTVVAALNLQGLNDVLSVLSANPRSLQIMEECIAQQGTDPDEWLPEFFDRIAQKGQALSNAA